MKIGVPKETAEGERRVALVPDVVKALTAKEIEVAVEPGAGEGASHPDSEYSDAGAKVGEDPWGADVVLKVTPPTDEEVGRLKQGQVLIGFLEPLTNPRWRSRWPRRGSPASRWRRSRGSRAPSRWTRSPRRRTLAATCPC